MPAQDTIYTPDLPTVNGTKITVDAMLKAPLRVERRLSNLALLRMVANTIFAQGANAPGGAIVYDRLGLNDLFTDRDVQRIEPMSEFPLLTDSQGAPLVANTSKYGGAFEVSYEEKRRNAIDIVQRKIDRLANTIARKVDTVAMAALDADPVIAANTLTASAAWANTSTGNPVGDVSASVAWIDNLDLGYTADTVLINPQSATDLLNNPKVTNAYPRESGQNPLIAGSVNGLLNLTWIQSNRVAKGTAYVFQARTPGSLHDEVAMYSRVTDQPRNESWLIQGARVTVPVITDPYAIRKIVGI